MNAKQAEGRRDGNSSFATLLEYIEDAEKTDGQVWLHNVVSVETAAAEMAATAASNPRVKDPIFHGILSWPTGEEPTADQAHEAALIALRRLGADTEEGGHQFAIAFHRDTDNLHVHFCLNRVHSRDTIDPEILDGVSEDDILDALKNPGNELEQKIRASWNAPGEPLHAAWAHKNLSYAAREVEIEQGWAHERGLFEVQELDGRKVIVASDYRNPENENIPGKARDMEAHAGVTSFARYVKEQCGDAVKAALKTGSWEKVHQALDRYGVELRPRGQGFVYVDQADPDRYHAKASTISSTSAAKLKKALGDYAPPSPDERQPATKFYDPDAPDGVRDLEREQIDKRKAEKTEKARARSPNRKRYSEQGKRENEDRKLDYKAGREALWREYIQTAREQRSARRAEKDRIWKEQRQRENDRWQQMKTDVKASASQAWDAWRRAPSSSRVHPAAIRAVIAVERGRQREQLERQRRQERAELKQRYGGRVEGQSWHQWIRERAQSGDEIAQRVKRGIDYRERRQQGQMTGQPQQSGEAYSQAEDALMQAQQVPEIGETGILDSVFAQMRADDVASPVYRDDERGIDIARDYGDRILVLAHDEQSLEQTLRIAAARYGGTLQLHGDDDFQRDAAIMAGQLGIRIANDDEELQQLWREARDEAQGRRPQRPTLPRVERQEKVEAKASAQAPKDKTSSSPKEEHQDHKPPPPPTVNSESEESGEVAETEDRTMPGRRPPRAKRQPPDYLDKDEIQTIKANADLVAIMQAYGYEIDEAESTKKSPKLRKGSEVRIVRRRSTGDGWFNPGSDERGDVIRFIRNENPGMKFQEAAREAQRYAGIAPVPALDRHRQRKEEETARSMDHTALRQRRERIQGGPDIFLKQRGLLGDETGPDCRIDPRETRLGEVNFYHRNRDGHLTGYERWGWDPNGEKVARYSKGGTKNLYRTGKMQDPARIVFVESGLDAESAKRYEEREDTLYASFGGAFGDHQVDLVDVLAERYPDAEIVAAFDNDERGDGYLDQVRARLGGSGREVIDGRDPLRASGVKDWNDLIRPELRDSAEEQGEEIKGPRMRR